MATAVTRGAFIRKVSRLFQLVIVAKRFNFFFRSLPSHNDIVYFRGRIATLFLEECPHSTKLVLSDTNEAPHQVHNVWPR